MGRFSKFQSGVSAQELSDLTGARKEKKESKVFQPGLYEVIVKDVEDKGPSRRDNDWLNYEFTFEGAGGKTIRNWLDIPLNGVVSPLLDGRYPGSTFQRLCRFLGSLGVPVDAENVGETLEKCFENPKALVGFHLKIEIGYKGPHHTFIRNDDVSGFQLVGRDNNPLDGHDEIFESRDALEAYVKQQDIKGYKSFPDIISYSKSDTKNSVDTLGSAKRNVGKALSAKDLM